MLSDLLKWGSRRPSRSDSASDLPPPKGGEPVVASKAFPKFLSALSHQPEPPVVIDFGPVIGGNVAFLGERLGCKLFIEDLVSELDRHRKAGTIEALPAAIEARLKQEPASVDGILCWDFFDYLDKATAQALARQLVTLLRPGGAVMGFFCTTAVERAPFTKFEMVDEHSLRHRHHAGAGGAKLPLLNRDIIKMFDGLIVSDSFLLKSNTREILLRRR
ncbi:MAG TPA: class I SAM-dependent methyltransferase [Vicinamibacterales bacterium]|nr:class I SAM-dependent methyltransferase [Vicinamibacterales bacterium]